MSGFTAMKWEEPEVLHFIYGLYHPADMNHCLYVGVTRNTLRDRVSKHITEATQGRGITWKVGVWLRQAGLCGNICKLKRAYTEPAIVALESLVCTEQCASKREARWTTFLNPPLNIYPNDPEKRRVTAKEMRNIGDCDGMQMELLG